MNRRWVGIVLAIVTVIGGLTWMLMAGDHIADRNIPGKTTTSGRNSLASPAIER